jgi:hypothetical protein
MHFATSLVLSLGLLSGACFPNNARHRTVAKIAEGGLALGGVVLLSGLAAPADCKNLAPGVPDTDCASRADLMGKVGLGLILTGLLGFVITVVTAEDDAENVALTVQPTSTATTATTVTTEATAAATSSSATVTTDALAPLSAPLGPLAPAR